MEDRDDVRWMVAPIALGLFGCIGWWPVAWAIGKVMGWL